MLRLVIGGYAQGKLNYVLEKYQLSERVVWDGAGCGMSREETALPKIAVGNDSLTEHAPRETVVLNHFHSWVKNRMTAGGCPEKEIISFLDRCGECIIICDEIGNGIVPAEPFEREYRERTGRLLVRLSERAEEVERVICGIGQRIK